MAPQMPNVYGNSNMTTCEQCPLRDGCIERRGICRDYILYMERVERVQKEIEKLNETKETPAEGAVPTNEAIEG